MEDSVFVRLSGDSFSGFGPGVTPVFDPFHTGVDPATAGFYFPNGGSDEWLTVEPLTEPKIYALEFLYGNGWTTGDINGVPWGNNDAYLEWRTFLDGNLVSSGTVGPNPQLAVGTVIGFYDFVGFDQIQLRCKIDSSFDPNLQAIALDDMYVQYTSVPEPATLAALGLGALFLRRRERTKTE